MDELLKAVQEKGENISETAKILSHWNKGTGIKKSAVILGFFSLEANKKIIQSFSSEEKINLSRELANMPFYNKPTIEAILKDFLKN